MQVGRTSLAHIAVSSVGTVLLVWYCLSRSLSYTQEFGLAFSVAAFFLWAAARLQIGGSFAVAPKAKLLVTRGLYSRIRNPIYLFGTLWIAGLMLAIDRPWWLLILFVLVPLQVVRAQKEARVLEEKFGDEYRAYRRRTWF